MGRKSVSVTKATAPVRKKNLKYTATSTAFRLARRWSRDGATVTVKKLRKLIGCIKKIGKEQTCISAELSRYLGKRILMNFIEEKGPHTNVNVKKELQQMLLDSSVWGIPNENFVRDYYAFIEKVESTLKHKEIKTESALVHALKHEVVLEQNKSLVLEFGVASGSSIREMAKYVPKQQVIFGFDSFDGLPDFWRTGFEKGKFGMKGGEPPLFQERNIKIIKGLFEDTCDSFFRRHNALNHTIAFIHIDCDIYSSTKTIFEALEKYAHKGNLLSTKTVIVFDELLCYNGFEKHEMLAFFEFLQKNPTFEYEIIGTKHHGCMSVAIRLIRKKLECTDVV